MYARKQEYNSQIEGLMGMTYAHKLRHMVHPKEFIRGGRTPIKKVTSTMQRSYQSSSYVHKLDRNSMTEDLTSGAHEHKIFVCRVTYHLQPLTANHPQGARYKRFYRGFLRKTLGNRAKEGEKQGSKVCL